MWYTYILRCEDGSLYSGITTDLPRRFREHASGGKKAAKYTLRHAPLGFEAAWQSKSRVEASRLEYRLKRLTKGEKENLIHGTVPEKLDMAGYIRIETPEAEA
ncbi:MAG: GIY-YIG nuclease family protein [Oscillospiraceae bacterium]|nr:GIY-YIG nuclease family protein [Oscillospiraceae bacterium]